MHIVTFASYVSPWLKCVGNTATVGNDGPLARTRASRALQLDGVTTSESLPVVEPAVLVTFADDGLHTVSVINPVVRMDESEKVPSSVYIAATTSLLYAACAPTWVPRPNRLGRVEGGTAVYSTPGLLASMTATDVNHTLLVTLNDA